MDAVTVLQAIVLTVAAFFIGGIPWGVIVARLSGGPDPRTIGSGRTGGANVMRALGPRLALLSGLLDMLKGTAAVLLARWVGAGIEVEVLAGLAAIIGHSRSPFLGFSGGRGVSAAFGAALVLAPCRPRPSSWSSSSWCSRSRATRRSPRWSRAAVGGVTLALQVIVTGQPPALLVFAIVGPVLIWLFHLDNIGRLLRGEERKFGAK